MFVRTMMPHPPRLLERHERIRGLDVRTRAGDERRVAQVHGAAVSGLTGSRKICTFDTATSSSAQPVTATAPLSPVAPCCGVSIVPNGGFEVPGAMIVTRTVTVGELCAPLAAMRHGAGRGPARVADRSATTAMVKRPFPVPVPFVIWIHG